MTVTAVINTVEKTATSSHITIDVPVTVLAPAAAPPGVDQDLYDHLTQAEKRLAWHNPWQAAQMVSIRSVALEMSQQRWGFAQDNTVQNAFQHAGWNCLMKQYFGGEDAKAWADAHEDFPNNNEASKEMDLHNNAVGRDWQGHTDNGLPSCDLDVDAAFQAGELWWFEQGPPTAPLPNWNLLE